MSKYVLQSNRKLNSTPVEVVFNMIALVYSHRLVRSRQIEMGQREGQRPKGKRTNGEGNRGHREKKRGER